MMRILQADDANFVYVWPAHKTLVEKLGINNALFLPRIWDTGTFKRKNLASPF